MNILYPVSTIFCQMNALNLTNWILKRRVDSAKWIMIYNSFLHTRFQFANDACLLYPQHKFVVHQS